MKLESLAYLFPISVLFAPLLYSVDGEIAMQRINAERLKWQKKAVVSVEECLKAFQDEQLVISVNIGTSSAPKPDTTVCERDM